MDVEPGAAPSAFLLAAHQISTFTALFLFVIMMFALSRLWNSASSGEAPSVGILRVVLMVAFEFGFGRFVAGHVWQKLFRDHNLFAGRLWILILLWLLTAPVLFHAL